MLAPFITYQVFIFVILHKFQLLHRIGQSQSIFKKCYFMEEEKIWDMSTRFWLFLFEMNVHENFLRLRKMCLYVVCCLYHAYVYVWFFKKYFHSTWISTLLIKVWLDVIFTSLNWNERIFLFPFAIQIMRKEERVTVLIIFQLQQTILFMIKNHYAELFWMMYSIFWVKHWPHNSQPLCLEFILP